MKEASLLAIDPLLVLMERVHAYRSSLALLVLSTIPIGFYMLYPEKKRLHFEKFIQLLEHLKAQIDTLSPPHPSSTPRLQISMPSFTSLFHTSNMQTIMHTIHSFAPHQIKYSFKSLETLSLLLRMLVSMDSRLQTPDVLEFLQELTLLEQKRYRRESFGLTTVVVFEGLPLSGKSTMATQLAERVHGKYLKFPSKSTKVRDIFTNHSHLMSMIFQHLNHYFMAEEIIESKEKIVFITDFYHHTNVTATCAMPITEEGLAHIPSSAFEWPLDLPSPSLVVYLAVGTDIRLQRGPSQPVDTNDLRHLNAQDSFRQVSHNAMMLR